VNACVFQRDTYIGAVVEYAPTGTPWDSTPEELLGKNTAKYVEIISQAAANVRRLFNK